jgi:menaquinone-9 beta-reductase
VALSDGTTLEAPVLIGADGVNSPVARAILGRAHDPARIGFALEVEAPARPDRRDLEIDFAAAAWGYGWVFPKAASLTVGVGGRAARNPDMKARLAAYLLRHGIDPAAQRIKGHHLPFGDYKRRPGRGRVLLAGDAAGLVDPITGEGIAWAIRSGALAAAAAAAALAAAAPERAFPAYRRALRPIHAEMRRARLLRTLIFAGPMRERFARMIAGQPRMQRRYLALLNGDLDYADIGAARMLRVLGRMLRAPAA